MYYYKVLDTDGNPCGVFAGTEPHPNPPDNYIQITYEEYLEVCEYLGIVPR